jgi:geranylgeranyl pyrophosphate synthase
MDAPAYLAERARLVDGFLERAVPAASEPPTRLHAAMRHLLFPGGKRLRPALACAAAEALGAAPETALPAAAAVELVHTYSLVHDDLPCMDDDATRRGRPTVHVRFDEATAVLAGDALLALAFETLASAPVAPPTRVALLRDLAHTAGSRALVGGQADDLVFASRDPACVESVHRRKSAALIATAVVSGARLAGADEPGLTRLRRFGECTGLAFQIADDLLDADEEDACSLVRAVGSEAAARRGQQLLEEALAELAELEGRAEPLRCLARYAIARDA